MPPSEAAMEWVLNWGPGFYVFPAYSMMPPIRSTSSTDLLYDSSESYDTPTDFYDS